MEATERFAALMSGPEPAAHPDEIALLIAAHARPDLDLDEERARLDRLAEGCPAPTLDGLRAHLFRDLHFRGNGDDYYDPRNSYLDEVVRRRLGIPITLAVLTIGVGRRLGVPLAGVGMPGHFLVADKVDDTVFLDPYHAGAVLDPKGCERLFHRLQGDDTPFHPSYLQPVGSHTIAARMLANLKQVFTARRDSDALVWVLRLRSHVPSVPADERAELAGVLAATGAFGQAAAELDALAAQVRGTEARGYEAAAARVRARLN